MEDNSLRTALLAAIAPAAWGTTYIVTSHLLPPDRPLFAAAMRALPAGLILLALTRRLPRGRWWGRAALLGLLNFGAFFPLLFLAAYELPGGVAATVQASSPLVVMALAWMLLGEQPGLLRITAGLVGVGGVALLVLQSACGDAGPLGFAAAAGSVVSSALGFVLVRRWPAPVSTLTLVSWQLVVGGLILAPLALLAEGLPPSMDLPAVGGLLWIGGVGTVVAYVCWFRGLARLPAGTVSLIGLVGPVVATGLGIVIAGEPAGPGRLAAMGLILAGVLLGQPAVAQLVRRRLTRPRNDVGSRLLAEVPAAQQADPVARAA
ncbi:DMT family transporter [Nocardioides bigeumensis]|uniref:EamA family transporter n=1 Tax=Nocardioides bigeumensis TaxID=433657 RepID=A0ABP5JA07_9ACTN